MARKGRIRVTRINNAVVGRILTSPGIRTACEAVAGGLASQVRARGSRTYPGSFGGWVRVEGTNRGGAQGDRAMATVLVSPPPADQVRFPDRDRFLTVQAVGRSAR